ncbi:MAG: OmpH family outer membrane protein [Planctomycetes bacterium]|nr:OmpH family outer membrane protein [Planctomycetota bacterium]
MRVLSVLVWLVAISGCGEGDDSHAAANGNGTANADGKPIETVRGGVAVIDLDAVLKRLGREPELNEQLELKRKLVNDGVAQLQKQLVEEFLAKQKEIGENPTDEQKRELATMYQRFQSQEFDAKRKAQQEVAEYRNTLVQKFREEVKPVAREAAAAKGLSVVLTKIDIVYVHDPAVDITDEVVGRLSAK